MQTQEILLAIFTGVLAIAVLMQTLIFFGMYKAIRKLVNRIDGISKDLLRNVDKVTAKAEETLTTIEDIGHGFAPVKDKVVDIAEILHQRVLRVDDFLEETTNTAREEVDRVKTRIESATNRAEELLEMMHDSILIPINQINAITRGIQAGIDFLFRRRRNLPETVQQAEADQQDNDEMFI